MRSRSSSAKLDYLTFSIYLALVGIGWAMIYTVGYGRGYEPGFFNFLNTPVGKQMVWIGISLGCFVLTLAMEAKFWHTFSSLIYLACIVLLVSVLLFGKTINGAKAWFDFGGGMTLQPAEFAKFGTCLAMASYLSMHTNTLRSFRTTVYSFVIFLVPLVLVLLQPDAGSAIVFLSFLIVMYREGLPGWLFGFGFGFGALFVLGLGYSPFLVTVLLAFICCFVLVAFQEKYQSYWMWGFTAVVLAGVVGMAKEAAGYTVLAAAVIVTGACIGLWFAQKRQPIYLAVLFTFLLGTSLVFMANYTFQNLLASHQQERINVWLKPGETGLQEAAYNLNNSKMAIGAGGMFGKGYLEGRVTQGNFVPEQITDFIFSAIGEEQGFVGVFIVLLLFMALFTRILFLAERQKSDFNRLYAYGVAGLLFVHFAVNISMTMGLLPIIGIPLPFISKGGSSLLAFSLMIAVLLKLDAARE